MNLISNTEDIEPRRRVQEAGRKVFADLGYDRATVSMICKEAGVNRAMVSYYHGGKLTLYRNIIETSTSSHLRGLREGIYNVEGPLDRLRAFVDIDIEFNLSQPEVREMLMREVGSNYAYAGDILENYFLQVIAVLTDVVQQGIDSGDFDKSMNPVDVALFIIGATTIRIVFSPFTKRINLSPQQDQKQLSSVKDYLYKLILHGISSNKE